MTCFAKLFNPMCTICVAVFTKKRYYLLDPELVYIRLTIQEVRARLTEYIQEFIHSLLALLLGKAQLLGTI